ncbi:MAG: imidazole glycerol phosphate synthase subunit HisH [Alphaproteobacteria bacterium]
MKTVVIVDYGLGNLASVASAVAHLGHEPMVTAEPDAVARAERVILPGVGAFGDGMARLRQRGLIAALERVAIERGRPLLGICLGGQLLATESEEFGHHEGLGWLPARVVRLTPNDPTMRVPHVGWNEVRQVAPCPLFEGIADGALFYHMHGYRLEAAEDSIVVGETDYGGGFPSVVRRCNLYATQFHPEKSQRAGLALLANFLERA